MNVGVIIGRFQPIHPGHMALYAKAVEENDEIVIVLGSADRAPSPRNPLSTETRMESIRAACFKESLPPPYIILPIRDSLYSNREWELAVEQQVTNIFGDANIRLYGHKRDHTSAYLSDFSKWEKRIFPPLASDVSSTAIRNRIYNINPPKYMPYDGMKYVSDQVYSEIYEQVEEARYLAEYKDMTQQGPYPTQFLTSDACVIYGTEILLVRRGVVPGKGLLALPGGFLETTETFEDGAIRELLEETNIDLPEPALRGSLTYSYVFDAPGRSERGRIVTKCHLFVLNTARQRPKVRAGDDAGQTWWHPINKLSSEDFFEDHYDIIQHMIKRIV